MAERAVFLDRDNTIIDNDGYLGDPSKVKLMPGAGTALASLRALGYRLIVISNQSGVARGMFKEADVEAVNDEMSRQLRKQAGAYIDASYYCPFHPEATVPAYRVDHDWRKPKPGMLKQAAADFHLDLAQCWMVGDQGRDVAAGTAAGCRTILLRDPEHRPAGGYEAETTNGMVSPSFVVRTLSDAARIIVREGRHSQPPPPPPPAPPAPEEPPAAPAPAAVAPTPPPPPPPPVVDAEELAARVAEKLARKFAAMSAPPAAPVPESSPATPAAALADRAALVPAVPVLAASVPDTTTSPAPAGGIPLEKQLDELVVQLRQQNRNANLRPDFSMSHIIVLIVQGFALVAMTIGFFKYFTIMATYKTAQDVQFAEMAQTQALIWILSAVFFQGVVLALLVYARQK
jgi:D,D-heptose 1,7-bisphosphate phosphatase